MDENELWCHVYVRAYADLLNEQTGRGCSWSREKCAQWAGDDADAAIAEAKKRGRLIEKAPETATEKE